MAAFPEDVLIQFVAVSHHGRVGLKIEETPM